MAKPKAVWFLPRTRDHPPEAAIRLGDVIASPWDPEEVMNGDAPPVIPTNLLRAFEQTDWSWKKEFARSHSGGVFAQFLQVVGVGVDLDADRSKSRTDVYNADRLVTESFTPNSTYLKDVLKDEDVRDALTGPDRRSKLFMVTGLKTAYGATKAMERMTEHGVHAQVSVNLGPFTGAPVTPGAKVGNTSSTSETLLGGKWNFVFGFQLRKLQYKKGRVVHSQHDKGALYGQTASEEDEENDEKAGDVDVADLDTEEPSLNELGGAQARTIEDAESGEEVDFIYI